MVHTPAYPFPVKHIELFNGSRIAYMDQGTGPQVILFIHGLANYAAGWARNIATLSGQYRCIALDLPGNGLSAPAAGHYTITYFASCIIDFIGRLNLQRVCLAGHSMGGQIALSAVLSAPACAERIVLCAPAGFETFTEMDRFFYEGSMQYMSMFPNDEYNLQETLRSSFYRFPRGADKMIGDLIALMRGQSIREYRRMVDQCIAGMLREPVYHHLKSVIQPTLVLFGEKDALIPNRILHPVSTREIGQRGARQMPDARLEMIPDCGHFLQWEKADHVNQHIRAFLN